MSLFSFNIFTGISFCCEAFMELRFWISVRNFFLSSYLKENLLLVVSIRFDTDYTGMLRELFNARSNWILLSGFRKMCFVSLYI